jgi:hypothetical protein
MADAHGAYKAMDRVDAIRAFNHDVVEKLRASAATSVNISHVFFTITIRAGNRRNALMSNTVGTQIFRVGAPTA